MTTNEEVKTPELQPYALSVYPRENVLIKVHPSNTCPQYYKREDADRRIDQLQRELIAANERIAEWMAVSNRNYKAAEAHVNTISSLQRRIAQLEKDVADKQELVKIACRDWADDDTAIKNLCAKYGIRDDDIPGEFKCALTCVEELAAKVDESLALARELGEALKRLNSLIDDGVLVRDISRDHEDGWAIKALALVRIIAESRTTLAKLSAIKERP